MTVINMISSCRNNVACYWLRLKLSFLNSAFLAACLSPLLVLLCKINKTSRNQILISCLLGLFRSRPTDIDDILISIPSYMRRCVMYRQPRQYRGHSGTSCQTDRERDLQVTSCVCVCGDGERKWRRPPMLWQSWAANVPVMRPCCALIWPEVTSIMTNVQQCPAVSRGYAASWPWAVAGRLRYGGEGCSKSFKYNLTTIVTCLFKGCGIVSPYSSWFMFATSHFWCDCETTCHVMSCFYICCVNNYNVVVLNFTFGTDGSIVFLTSYNYIFSRSPSCTYTWDMPTLWFMLDTEKHHLCKYPAPSHYPVTYMYCTVYMDVN